VVYCISLDTLTRSQQQYALWCCGVGSY